MLVVSVLLMTLTFVSCRSNNDDGDISVRHVSYQGLLHCLIALVNCSRLKLLADSWCVRCFQRVLMISRRGEDS